MSPRAYRPGRRQAAAQETRQRILSAGRSLLVQQGFYAIGLEEVARAADVSRQTVYYQFGSKLGLLEAITRDATERAGLGRVFAALAQDDVLAAVRGALTIGSEFWAAEYEVFRQVIGLELVDAELAPAAAQREQQRRADLEQLATRLADAGRLRPGWTVPRAADALFLLTSFVAFDQLYGTCRLAVPDVAARLLELARAVIDGL